MTRAETIAFNAGVTMALNHARRIAEVIESRTKRPLAEGFAVEALKAFAEEGRALLIEIERIDVGTAHNGTGNQH